MGMPAKPLLSMFVRVDRRFGFRIARHEGR
jgi:hypothetical protein